MLIKFKCYTKLFDFGMWFCIGETQEAVAFANLTHGLKSGDKWNEDDFKGHGASTLSCGNRYPIIHLKAVPVTAREHGILSHEIFHAVCLMSKRAGFKLGADSEETFAYSIQFLTESFWNEIAKRKLK